MVSDTFSGDRLHVELPALPELRFAFLTVFLFFSKVMFMYSSLYMSEAIPEEYQKVAQSLFSAESGVEAAASFAEILGIGEDYQRLLAVTSASDIHQRLVDFQHNLDLLIQKTWVEKCDEVQKEKLRDKAPDFIAKIEDRNYREALADFSAILDELAYLFFGMQSRKHDFTEYTFRIDTQMGLFWWYGAKVGQLDALQQLDLEESGEKDYLYALLLLGICYLTNF
jgi:hypothetical protein